MFLKLIQSMKHQTEKRFQIITETKILGTIVLLLLFIVSYSLYEDYDSNHGLFSFWGGVLHPQHSRKTN